MCDIVTAIRSIGYLDLNDPNIDVYDLLKLSSNRTATERVFWGRAAGVRQAVDDIAIKVLMQEGIITTSVFSFVIMNAYFRLIKYLCARCSTPAARLQICMPKFGFSLRATLRADLHRR